MTNQQAHFNELYDVFLSFYQAAIKTADAPYEKVRLQLTTVFFDDLELLKVVQPVFMKFPSTVEDKRACARAAYLDAVTLHNRTAGIKWETVSEKQLKKEGSQIR